MKQLTVAARLALGFGIIIVLSFAIGVTAYVSATRLAADTENVYRDGVLASQRLALAQTSLWELRFGVANYAALPKPEARGKIVAAGSTLFQTMDESLAEYRKANLSPEATGALAELDKSYATYKANRPGWFELMETGKLEEAADYREKNILHAAGDTVAALTKLIEIQSRDSAAAAQLADDLARSLKGAIALTLLLVLVLSVTTAAWIIRSVTRPLGGEPHEAKATVERIARGDLTAEIGLHEGDGDSLLAAMKRMQASLRKMVGDLKANAEGVASAAGQLATASAEVAATTANQSEAASAMAATVQQVAVSINHVADSARDAHEVTARTGSMSQDGNRVIKDTVAEMQAISTAVGQAAATLRATGENSQKISGIVQVIKAVAEQTNLLALNAAIEAARAGEQGRGFAVVADEVRKLAERSAHAANEVGGMIIALQDSAKTAVDTMEQAVERVGQGVAMANKASESMIGIAEGAERVVDAVNDISDALKEQSVAGNHIAANVEKIATMSEENRAATRAAADTARHLEQLAAATRQAVAVFSV
jgi:methyl-accepting chemotaxis protein